VSFDATCSRLYAPPVRFLFVNNHCISDPTAGVTQSLRTIMEWLAAAGHDCHILTTARFESAVTFTIEEHLRARGLDVPSSERTRSKRAAKSLRLAGRPVLHYDVSDVPVTLLMTRHNDERRPDPRESKQYLALLDRLFDEFAPTHLIACNGHPMILEAMTRARRRGLATAFAVRGFGYYDRRYFADVDHAFTCSQFLTDHYRARVGLESTPLEPPLDWSTVVAPTESRAFVTFVNPSLHKGLFLFARLADMLGAKRPDIPILVIQSGRSGGSLNAIPGIDFSRYPQIMAAPPVPKPADYFALTRLLVAPSVWEEPFGRVAAEAMVNAIPPLVSDRGSLPDVVGGDFNRGGGGRVLPIPIWMSHETKTLPSESEVQPWFDAVCALWDDPPLYRSMADRARQIADARYSEATSRAKHLDYFTSLMPGGRPLEDAAVARRQE
jgi:glycosyltransferase involved in cell wall biosynthesis